MLIIRHSRNGKTKLTVKQSVATESSGEREEGCVMEAQGTFRGVRLFCMTLQWQIHAIMLLTKPIELCNTNKL